MEMSQRRGVKDKKESESRGDVQEKVSQGQKGVEALVKCPRESVSRTKRRVSTSEMSLRRVIKDKMKAEYKGKVLHK
ncbi:hypothetical protein [Neobacillus sp. LXY-4]|uniref:hypothetical protein n=1 Tax=Neobacillus sp. LXY-4 TaxID=3379826 RepID=UPI003EE23C01